MFKQSYIQKHLLCHAIVCQFLVIDIEGGDLEKKRQYTTWRENAVFWRILLTIFVKSSIVDVRLGSKVDVSKASSMVLKPLQIFCLLQNWLIR